jgi:DNA-binding SARP family transcriptional activator
VQRGRAREARRHYAAFAERLRDDMGLTPTAETRAALGAG